MIALAGWLLLTAAAMGAGLGAVLMKGDAAPRLPAWPAWLHGTIGICGTCALLLALRGPPRGVASGAGGFGMVATYLLAGAIFAAAWVFRARTRRRTPAGAVVAIHAMLGISGVVMFLAWWSAGG